MPKKFFYEYQKRRARKSPLHTRPGSEREDIEIILKILVDAPKGTDPNQIYNELSYILLKYEPYVITMWIREWSNRRQDWCYR